MGANKPVMVGEYATQKCVAAEVKKAGGLTAIAELASAHSLAMVSAMLRQRAIFLSKNTLSKMLKANGFQLRPKGGKARYTRERVTAQPGKKREPTPRAPTT